MSNRKKFWKYFLGESLLPLNYKRSVFLILFSKETFKIYGAFLISYCAPTHAEFSNIWLFLFIHLILILFQFLTGKGIGTEMLRRVSSVG